MARRGKAWHGEAGNFDKEGGRDLTRLAEQRYKLRRGLARPGAAGHGEAWPGLARLGGARQGMAWQGKGLPKRAAPSAQRIARESAPLAEKI